MRRRSRTNRWSWSRTNRWVIPGVGHPRGWVTPGGGSHQGVGHQLSGLVWFRLLVKAITLIFFWFGHFSGFRNKKKLDLKKLFFGFQQQHLKTTRPPTAVRACVVCPWLLSCPGIVEKLKMSEGPRGREGNRALFIAGREARNCMCICALLHVCVHAFVPLNVHVCMRKCMHATYVMVCVIYVYVMVCACTRRMCNLYMRSQHVCSWNVVCNGT